MGINKSTDDLLLTFLPGETAKDAYERLKKEIASHIDAQGADGLMSQITSLVGSPESGVIIDAFLMACLRCRRIIHDQECDGKLLMLPLMMRSSDDSSLPGQIDDSTSERIQRLMLEKLCKAEDKDALVLPVSRLYTSDEFDCESPDFIYRVLSEAMEQVASNIPGFIPHRVVVMGDDEDRNDNGVFLYQGQYITYRLLPFVLIAPAGVPVPPSLNSPELLNQIAGLVSMCGMKKDGLKARGIGAEIFGPTITPLTVMPPHQAHSAADAAMDLERILIEIKMHIDSFYPSKSAATITFDPLNSKLSVMIIVQPEGGGYHEETVGAELRETASSYRLIEILARGIENLGCEKVAIKIAGSEEGALMASATLH